MISPSSPRRLPGRQALCHLSSYVIFVNPLSCLREKSSRKSLCIKKKVAGSKFAEISTNMSLFSLSLSLSLSHLLFSEFKPPDSRIILSIKTNKTTINSQNTSPLAWVAAMGRCAYYTHHETCSPAHKKCMWPSQTDESAVQEWLAIWGRLQRKHGGAVFFTLASEGKGHRNLWLLKWPCFSLANG